jgi:hypothetical protein
MADNRFRLPAASNVLLILFLAIFALYAFLLFPASLFVLFFGDAFFLELSARDHWLDRRRHLAAQNGFMIEERRRIARPNDGSRSKEEPFA